jgi:hypothetical protein
VLSHPSLSGARNRRPFRHCEWHPVVGDLIGGPSLALANPAITYRVDITQSGLISPGTTNTLIVEGLDLGAATGTQCRSGRLRSVIFKKANRANASINVRDGNDFTFGKHAGALGTTRTQTFRFKAANRPRTTTLSLFVADAVTQTADVVVITVGSNLAA